MNEDTIRDIYYVEHTATDLIRLAADQNFSDCCFDFSEQLGSADVTVELFAFFTHVVPPISSSRFA